MIMLDPMLFGEVMGLKEARESSDIGLVFWPFLLLGVLKVFITEFSIWVRSGGLLGLLFLLVRPAIDAVDGFLGLAFFASAKFVRY